MYYWIVLWSRIQNHGNSVAFLYKRQRPQTQCRRSGSRTFAHWQRQHFSQSGRIKMIMRQAQRIYFVHNRHTAQMRIFVSKNKRYIIVCRRIRFNSILFSCPWFGHVHEFYQKIKKKKITTNSLVGQYNNFIFLGNWIVRQSLSSVVFILHAHHSLWCGVMRKRFIAIIVWADAEVKKEKSGEK